MILRHKMVLKSALDGLVEALQPVKVQAAVLVCEDKNRDRVALLAPALRVARCHCTVDCQNSSTFPW